MTLDLQRTFHVKVVKIKRENSLAVCEDFIMQRWLAFPMKERSYILLLKVQRSLWYPLKIWSCNIYNETINIVIQNWPRENRIWVTNLARDVGKADSSLLTISVQFHLAWLRHLLEFNAPKMTLFVHFAWKPFAGYLENSRWFVYLFKFPLRSTTRIFQSVDIHFLSFNWFLKSTIYFHISRTLPDMQISFLETPVSHERFS